MAQATSDKPPQIYALMSKIMADLEPIAKDGTNTIQRYNYRSIDAILGALHKVLADNGVFFAPGIQNIQREERPGREGGVLAFVTVTVQYHFYAADGSNVFCSTVGEGMDSGDKATKKAMTSAVKTMLEQVFCIETGEGMDNEIEDPQPALKKPSDLKTCPRCGAVAVMPSMYPGARYYCKACKAKLDEAI
jgi:hypothetical protein